MMIVLYLTWTAMAMRQNIDSQMRMVLESRVSRHTSNIKTLKDEIDQFNHVFFAVKNKIEALERQLAQDRPGSELKVNDIESKMRAHTAEINAIRAKISSNRNKIDEITALIDNTYCLNIH